MYLNTINYGQGAYGIQAAAQRYYGKDAKDLTIAQAATLIGIPQSTTPSTIPKTARTVATWFLTVCSPME